MKRMKVKKDELDKIFLRIIAGVLKVIVSVLLILLVARMIHGSVMRYKHSIQSPGIDSMETIDIGEIKQCLYIRGKNIENPVILFLHGGPGTPEMPVLYKFQYDWEDDFTIVHWDQRGAGKTYFANDQNDIISTLNFQQLVDDAWELTQYIQKRFKKDKIIVLGHSWGTVLGTTLVQKHPDAFSAYIGVGQIINGIDGERIGFKKVLDLARYHNDRMDISELENLKPYPSSKYDSKSLMTVRQKQVKYGVAVGANASSILSYYFSPYLSLKDLTYYLINPFDMQKEIMQYVFHEFDIREYGNKYAMPIFYILGENDYQAPTIIAKEYFEEIKAPIKEIFIIPKAGHAPMIDNPQSFTKILKDEIKSIIVE